MTSPAFFLQGKPALRPSPLRAPYHALALAIAAIWFDAPPVRAGDARHLMYASVDATADGGYGGIGWMMAPNGLDHSGPVFSAETGRSLTPENRAAAMAGWRVSTHKTIVTLLGGFEAATTLRPVASADVWWDNAGWMATGRVQATTDYASWRIAIGRKASERLPWIGPEVSSAGEESRFGAHVTAIRLPAGVEARASAGWSKRGAFGELSLWRRF
ncbi:hypothetical protein FHS81_002099 [Pseudochelatococcus contaminans]|uniref:Cellulose biosynthesis protein BcsS n=2 Tax=Pseudochelatococcus contaminans TaxID=1538103 RepID=A0A7W5Z4G9_9HYPH|nr:hypothetical protein [Pseudochelatococcus contaminans]